MKLSDPQYRNLAWLAKNGGRGVLYRDKVKARGEESRGCAEPWLHLVAKGCVDGEGGELRITELGRRTLNPFEKRCSCLSNQLGPDYCEVHAA